MVPPSAAPRRTQRSPRPTVIALGIAATWLALEGSTRADSEPGGPVIAYASRPETSAAKRPACSFRYPLCVHPTTESAPPVALAALAAAEHAWGTLTGALALPPPDPDLTTGAFDIYLEDHVEGVAVSLLEDRDPRSAFDRASAFALLDAHAAGCERDSALARALARAILWRSAPAIDEASAESETSYLARLVVPCALDRVDGIARFQRHPECALTDRASFSTPMEAEEFDRGAALFPWWLDSSFGRRPGSIMLAFWALAPTKTPPGEWRWAGAPTWLDVLRASFKGALTTGSTIDDLWLDFAVARAFVGNADDGEHLPESRGIGAAGRVREEWDIPWPDRPRHLASGVGVEPTGAAYVAISHDGAAAEARLRVEATWEEHATMRWVVVKLDSDGKEMGRVAIPAADRATAAQVTVVDLRGVARLLVVGTNTGDPLLPFDPNDEVWEPHGWTLTLASE
jgi:hypothetical protein